MTFQIMLKLMVLVLASLGSTRGFSSTCAQREEVWDNPGSAVEYELAQPAHTSLNITTGVFIAPQTANYMVSVTVEVKKPRKKRKRSRAGYWLGGSNRQYRKLRLGKVS